MAKQIIDPNRFKFDEHIARQEELTAEQKRLEAIKHTVATVKLTKADGDYVVVNADDKDEIAAYAKKGYSEKPEPKQEEKKDDKTKR